MGRAGYLKGLVGPVDDVTPHHYGMCDIYWMFSDAVYVMALATAVCRMMLTVPRGLTVSRVSITKASGLSDAPGAERSPGGKTGDTVTHVWQRGMCGMGGVHGGLCMAGGHAWHTVNEWVVRILLECMLVLKLCKLHLGVCDLLQIF